MTVNINIKKKYKINGKEYSSVEEMPQNIREAFEKAMASKTGLASMTTPATRTKIIFNGTEYNNIDEMPQDVRSLYEKILLSSKTTDGSPHLDLNDLKGLLGKTDTISPGNIPQPTRFEKSFSSRTIILITGIAIFLILFFYLWKVR
jgi:hypothetical protein